MKMHLFHYLARKTIRKDVIQHVNSLNSDLDNQSQCKSVHEPIHMEVIENMRLSGINIETNELVTQASIKITQLMCFKAQARKPAGNI